MLYIGRIVEVFFTSSYAAIVVILDGCNVNALKYAETPCLKGLMEKGAYTFNCKSVFPSVTYTAHATIVTGVYPQEHGIVGNCFYDRVLGRIIDFDVEDVNKYLLTETFMEKISGIKACIGEPITKGCNIIVPKAEVQLKNLFKQDLYSLNTAIKIIKKYRPILTIINLPGIDSIGEIYGPLSKELFSHLKTVDKLICNLVNIAENLYDDYLFIVLADHGMVSIRENINLDKVLKGLNVISCVSHRAAHIYASSNLEEVIRSLKRSGKFELILSRKELSKYYLENPRSGDIVVAVKEGYELGNVKLRGSHGGISRSEFLVPLIINKPEYAYAIKNPDITIVPKIVLRYLREVEAIEIVKEELKKTDPAHGWLHTLRVLKVATKLALKYNADIEAVRLACIFHDSKRGIKPENHELRSAALAEKYLKERNYPLKFIVKVKEIILKHHEEPGKLKTLEEKILWDADKVDALGVIGLARCFLEAGFHGETINSAINHALRDLKEFKDKMHFAETLKLAEIKAANMIAFIDKLRDELNKYG